MDTSKVIELWQCTYEDYKNNVIDTTTQDDENDEDNSSSDKQTN